MTKGVAVYKFYIVGYHNAFQSFATFECLKSYINQAVRQFDLFQVNIIMECIVANAANALRNGDFFDRTLIGKRAAANNFCILMDVDRCHERPLWRDIYYVRIFAVSQIFATVINIDRQVITICKRRITNVFD